MCRLALPGARNALSFQKYIAYVACSKPLGVRGGRSTCHQGPVRIAVNISISQFTLLYSLWLLRSALPLPLSPIPCTLPLWPPQCSACRPPPQGLKLHPKLILCSGSARGCGGGAFPLQRVGTCAGCGHPSAVRPMFDYPKHPPPPLPLRSLSCGADRADAAAVDCCAFLLHPRERVFSKCSGLPTMSHRTNCPGPGGCGVRRCNAGTRLPRYTGTPHYTAAAVVSAAARGLARAEYSADQSIAMTISHVLCGSALASLWTEDWGMFPSVLGVRTAVHWGPKIR